MQTSLSLWVISGFEKVLENDEREQISFCFICKFTPYDLWTITFGHGRLGTAN